MFAPFIQYSVKSTFVFDSKFITYTNLSALNERDIKFITLWRRIYIPHAKRKYPKPLMHESIIEIKDYKCPLRQVIIWSNGHEKPAFLLSNDFDSPLELLVGNCSRRWRVENTISEAVKCFNLNMLSSPILVKVHFDVIMTMIANTLYSMLAKKLRGFEHCDAQKVYRHFVKGKANVSVKKRNLTVSYPKRVHNPILRAASWHRMPRVLNWLDGANLDMVFR